MPLRPAPILIALLAGLGLLPFASRAEAEGDAKPNILFLMSDDQAWNGTSVAMHPQHAFARSTLVETPNLEKLASQGMRFSSAYAPAPMCAPTRLALQTGRSPAAHHWTKAGSSMQARAGYKLLGPTQKRTLPAVDITAGEMLQKAGYRTAHFGKWHLGDPGPSKHGYDESDGALGNEYAAKHADPNPVDIFGMTTRAIAFMKDAKAQKKPFFVQMSWHALHEPGNALKATLAKYAKKLGTSNSDRRVSRAAIAEDLDTGVGRLLDALAELGLAKSTYVIYTSDNGAGGGGGGRGRRGRRGGDTRLNGGKGSVREGGVRVPLIIRGPGVAAGSWSHVPVTGLDFYPTYAAWAGVRALPPAIEGGSLTPLLRAGGKGRVARSREGLYFHFPHYQGSNKPQSAIRLGSLKLIHDHEDDRYSLFDLEADILEQRDLSQERKEDTAGLKAALHAWLKAVDAQGTQPNPQYDPDNPPEPRKRGGRRGKGKGR